MIISRLDYRDYLFDFCDGKYTMSYVAMKEVRIRVIRLETHDGQVGWGEIVRKPNISADEVGPLELPILHSLIGKPLEILDSLVRDLQQDAFHFRGLAFGLETAYLDLIARRAQQPLCAHLGGMKSPTVPDYFSYSSFRLSDFKAAFHPHRLEHTVVQIKVGSNGIDEDQALIAFALEKIDDRQSLLVDFNGALDTDTAISVLREFQDTNIIWEEPCNSAEENIEVSKRTKQPVMFDQCLVNLEVVEEVIECGAAHSLVIKPALLGGLTLGQAARDLCIQHLQLLRMDGPWSGQIATAALMHLTVGVPPDLLISGGDLYQKLELRENWGGIENCEDGRIKPSKGIGHGAEPLSFF